MDDSQISDTSNRRDPAVWIDPRSGESRLASLLDDPSTRLLMQRDGVVRESFLRNIRAVRARLRKARVAPPPPRRPPASEGGPPQTM